MQGELGDDYVLYLLEDQEENPVAVVLPKDAAEQPLPAAQEVSAACPCCPNNLPIPCVPPRTMPADAARSTLRRCAQLRQMLRLPILLLMAVFNYLGKGSAELLEC